MEGEGEQPPGEPVEGGGEQGKYPKVELDLCYLQKHHSAKTLRATSAFIVFSFSVSSQPHYFIIYLWQQMMILNLSHFMEVFFFMSGTLKYCAKYSSNERQRLTFKR